MHKASFTSLCSRSPWDFFLRWHRHGDECERHKKHVFSGRQFVAFPAIKNMWILLQALILLSSPKASRYSETALPESDTSGADSLPKAIKMFQYSLRLLYAGPSVEKSLESLSGSCNSRLIWSALGSRK